MATSYDFVVDVSNQNDDWCFIAMVLRLGGGDQIRYIKKPLSMEMVKNNSCYC